MEKISLTSPSHYKQNEFQINCRSKYKIKTVKLLEENIGEHFSDPGVGHSFLNRTQKVLTIKKIDKFGYINIILRISFHQK